MNTELSRILGAICNYIEAWKDEPIEELTKILAVLAVISVAWVIWTDA